MKYTGNYNLKKPEGNDVVNIDDLNDNADIIDQKLKENADALESHKNDNVKHITSAERNAWNSKQNALPAERIRKIIFGTGEPTGGEDGDIYFQYEE